MFLISGIFEGFLDTFSCEYKGINFIFNTYSIITLSLRIRKNEDFSK